MSRTVNVGTIGHVDHGKSSLVRSVLFALAAAGVLHAAPSVPVLPERRREFEPGFDLNQLLDDAGKRGERQARKADRRERMKSAQRAALEGRR
ncbi:hypothetical protein Dolphis_88 [Pseudomonas phage Dolphis]|nr:hypothetical protein Dolphis_88 [Pseudomonas phage Dolphis]